VIQDGDYDRYVWTCAPRRGIKFLVSLQQWRI